MKKIKFSSEFEMCKHVTIILSGLLVPRKHKHIPEVPRYAYNNHSDMLFIMKTGNMFVVEYKLSGSKSLLSQVKKSDYAIGIVNQSLGKSFYEKNNDPYRHRIFSYTGQDWEIEKIAEFLIYRFPSYSDRPPRIFGKNYKDVQYGLEPVYYWGYRKTESSFIGGIKSGKRISLFQLYIQAVKNIQEYYDYNLDSYLIHKALGFYSLGTSRQHFETAMNQLKKEGKIL